MTIFTIDHADSGEIPRYDSLGDDTRDLRDRVEMRDYTDTGERTQRIDPRLIQAPSFDAIPRRTIDIDETVTFHSPMTVATGQTERVAAPDETAVQGILESLAGATVGVDGELDGPQPKPTQPLPPDPRPAAPGKYQGRHRLTALGRWRRLSPELRAMAWLLLGAALAVSGLWQVL